MEANAQIDTLIGQMIHPEGGHSAHEGEWKFGNFLGMVVTVATRNSRADQIAVANCFFELFESDENLFYVLPTDFVDIMTVNDAIKCGVKPIQQIHNLKFKV